MKKTSIILLFCLLIGQYGFSQTTFIGKLNLNQKDQKFTLISDKDSLTVSIDKKDINFDANTDFQLIRIKNSEYKFVLRTDTLTLTEGKSKIEYSNGLIFNISKKKAHQIILKDNIGNTVLDAHYDLKGNIADFNIKITNKKFEAEILAYATKYLFELSVNEVNTFVPYYLFMYGQ